MDGMSSAMKIENVMQRLFRMTQFEEAILPHVNRLPRLFGGAGKGLKK